MFGSSSSSSESSVEDEAGVEAETILLEGAPMEDRRISALEMAVGLVVNRESGEDAVAITRIADVFLAWLEEDDE